MKYIPEGKPEAFDDIEKIMKQEIQKLKPGEKKEEEKKQEEEKKEEESA